MSAAALRLDHLSGEALSRQSADWWRSVLGVVGFDEPPVVGETDVPVAVTGTPTLGGRGMCEIWRATGSEAVDFATGRACRGHLHYRHCGDLLFGAIALEEREFKPERGCESASAALLIATTTAYEAIFRVIAETGHEHLIRVWNYVPEINAQVDGQERYRRFNAARQTAFRNAGRSTVGSVPAASALGSVAGNPVSIYFLASRQPPAMIENPRQVSAYHYPRKFGVHSPTFSRACVLRGPGTNLLVSGTASIVGHESIHPGDATAQTHETLANIEALVDEANRQLGEARYALDCLAFKVYVRSPRDLPAIERVLSAALPAATVLYLEADVCREDLLVEIEATGEPAGQLQLPPGARRD